MKDRSAVFVVALVAAVLTLAAPPAPATGPHSPTAKARRQAERMIERWAKHCRLAGIDARFDHLPAQKLDDKEQKRAYRSLLRGAQQALHGAKKACRLPEVKAALAPAVEAIAISPQPDAAEDGVQLRDGVLLLRIAGGHKGSHKDTLVRGLETQLADDEGLVFPRLVERQVRADLERDLARAAKRCKLPQLAIDLELDRYSVYGPSSTLTQNGSPVDTPIEWLRHGRTQAKQFAKGLAKLCKDRAVQRGLRKRLPALVLRSTPSHEAEQSFFARRPDGVIVELAPLDPAPGQAFVAWGKTALAPSAD